MSLRKIRRTGVALALLVCVAPITVGTGQEAGVGSSNDWPQWRGPNGTGIAPGTDLPTHWAADENVAWRAPLDGLGVSSPIVWGDRVFVTYQRGTGVRRPGSHPTLSNGVDDELERPLGEVTAADAGDESDIGVVFGLVALDRSDGRQLWEHTIDAEGELFPVHDKHNLASPSPVTDGTLVYAWFGTGQLIAVDYDGRPAWSRNLGTELGPFEIGWGHTSSPTLYRDRLILQADHPGASNLLALDKRTGEEIWTVDRGRGLVSYSTPMVVPGPAGDELIVNSSQRLEGFDPDSGELLWYAGEPNNFPIPVPTYAGGMLFTSRGYRSGPYMAIQLGGRGDVSSSHVTWRVPTGAPYVSSIIHYEGLVYMANGTGIVTCVDAETGERVWQERLGGVYTASPLAGDGKIYLFSETGETLVLRAGRTPEVLARNELGERTLASPAIAGGQLFIRTDRHIVAIGS